jgi:hypothetical protein
LSPFGSFSRRADRPTYSEHCAAAFTSR